MADFFHDVESKISPIHLVVAFGTLCLLTYPITYLISSSTLRSYWKDDRPPLAPYGVPLLRHALAFFWNTSYVEDVQKSVSVPEKFENAYKGDVR